MLYIFPMYACLWVEAKVLVNKMPPYMTLLQGHSIYAVSLTTTLSKLNNRKNILAHQSNGSPSHIPPSSFYILRFFQISFHLKACPPAFSIIFF